MQVQYPDALQTMMADLKSIRKWAGFLQKTEIQFDLVNSVDELAKQARKGHLGIHLSLHVRPAQGFVWHSECAHMHLPIGQVELEFDFRREAAVMDAVADNLHVRAALCATPLSVLPA